METFKLIVHELLGFMILNCKKKNEILKAYASQKYTIKRNETNFYIAQQIQNIKSVTEKSLINHLVIQFEAFLIPLTLRQCIQMKYIVILNENQKIPEIECRRYIKSNNLILQKKLGISCNDLSNLQYTERNVEIVLEDENNKNTWYRCIININTGFSIQRKCTYKYKEKFIQAIHSLELVCYSYESPKFDDSYIFVLNFQTNSILGIASFLDCNNVSIKTTYLDDKQGSVLYQRIVIDDYKNEQPFILEHEFLPCACRRQPNKFICATCSKSLERYFQISCLLNAKLPNHFSLTNGYTNISTKPLILDKNSKLKKISKNKFYKLDGILATLKFYNHHFVISTNQNSKSYPHTLPKKYIHRLKDFSFVVESNLYESMFVTPADEKPKAAAIIDFHNLSISASRRMKIIQCLKFLMAIDLSQYLIFFQGENINHNNNNNVIYNPNINRFNTKIRNYLKSNFIFFVKKASSSSFNNPVAAVTLQNGKIYETTINKCYKVISLVKSRPDKIYPNNRRYIDTLIKML